MALGPQPDLELLEQLVHLPRKAVVRTSNKKDPGAHNLVMLYDTNEFTESSLFRYKKVLNLLITNQRA